MIKDDLTYKIIGCAMNVHNELGNGFQEVIYQRCLALELAQAGIEYKRETNQRIFYKGVEVGTRRADFVIGKKVVVELKAVIDLGDVHLAQAKIMSLLTILILAYSSTSALQACNINASFTPVSRSRIS